MFCVLALGLLYCVIGERGVVRMLKMNKKVLFAGLTAALLAPLAAQAQSAGMTSIKPVVGYCDHQGQAMNSACASSAVDPFDKAAPTKIAPYVDPAQKSNSYIKECAAQAIVQTQKALKDALVANDDYQVKLTEFHSKCPTSAIQPTLIEMIDVDYVNIIRKGSLQYSQPEYQGIKMFVTLHDYKSGETLQKRIPMTTDADIDPVYRAVDLSCKNVKTFIEELDTSGTATGLIEGLDNAIDNGCKISKAASDSNSDNVEQMLKSGTLLTPPELLEITGDKSSSGVAL